MNIKIKGSLSILASIITLFISGCGDSNTTETTPAVKIVQNSSALQLEVPPVAPAIR